MRPLPIAQVVTMFVLVTLLAPTQPASADARVQVVCGAFHFIRQGLEIGTTSINFRNADLINAATIQRLTIRDFSGNVVSDSGPAVGVPHALNTDLVPPRDITTVPPGASYYIATNHIWDNNVLPQGNQEGFSLSVVVEYSKAGDPHLLFVGGSLRVRQLTSPGTPSGIEHSRASVTCTRIH